MEVMQEDEGDDYLTSSQCLQEVVPPKGQLKNVTRTRKRGKYRKKEKKKIKTASLKKEPVLNVRKINFLGMDAPFFQWQHKYNYVKHLVGPHQRPLYVKLLNLDRLKRSMEGRKLMNLNYVASTTKYFPRSQQRTKGFDWFKDLQSKEALLKKKGHKMIVDKYQRFRRNLPPQPQEPAKCGQVAQWPTTSMHFSNPMDFSDPSNTAKRIAARFESPFEAAEKKNRSRTLAQERFEKLFPGVSAGMPRGRRRDGNVQKFPDKLEMIKDMRRLIRSHDFEEVLVNFRMTEFDPKKRPNRTTLFKLFSVALRRGVNTHDWALVSKSCESLSLEVLKGLNRESGWCLWNGGFLALLNTYKDDMSVLTKCGMFTKDLLNAYPRRIGIDLATWFTQKGFFVTAVQNLEEMHDAVQPFNTWLREAFNNPKKDLIDFIAELFTAVNQYAIYKHNKELQQEGLIQVDPDELYRRGEFVLSLFELLEGRGKSFENDTTIFIEPLIELTRTFRGAGQAKETLERICRKNYGNGILKEIHLKFLLEHFPNSAEDIEEERNSLAQYDFSLPSKSKAVRQARFNRFLRRLPRVSSFKGLDNPSFSW